MTEEAAGAGILRIDADKAKPFEEFATAINAELTRLKLPVPAGAPAG